MVRLAMLAVVVVATTRIAGADPAAEKLFRDGKALRKAGKLTEACDAFERSDQLEPMIGTLLNLADCRERQGRTATAWSLFVEAKVRAAPTKDIRGKTAAQRAAKLEPKLAYVTLAIAPDQLAAGLVIKRNGTVVDPAAWNTAVPLDPGDYEFEASAPAYQPSSTKQPIKPGERVTVVIAPLVAEPTPPDPKSAPLDVRIQPLETRTEPLSQPPPDPRIPPAGDTLPLHELGDVDPPRRPFALGVALGVALGTTSSAPPSSPDVTQDDHVPIGVRILGSIPVPRGAVRGIGSALYTKGLNDKTDSTNTKKLYVLGLSADYVWMPRPHLGFGAGIGIGLDYEVRSTGQGTDTSRWTTLRASPIIVRLVNGRVELGLHVQLLRRGDATGFLGLAAIDFFPL